MWLSALESTSGLLYIGKVLICYEFTDLGIEDRSLGKDLPSDKNSRGSLWPQAVTLD